MTSRLGARVVQAFVIVLALALSMAAAISAAAAPAATRGLANFTAVASAEGTRVTVLASGAVLTDTVADVGSPVAQAQLDSLGGSSAFGSVLYPGDLVVTAPGLVAGASGGKANVPAYPLIASASTNGTPSSKMEVPASSAQADASPTQATGRSTNGTSTQSGGTATVTSFADAAVTDAGSVTVTATSNITSLTIGPLVLGSVQSNATAVLGTDGTVSKTAVFDASAATVAGAPVAITHDGLSASAPLQRILEQAGVSVRYLDQQQTETGIISAGLAVTKRQDLPGAITPAAVVYTFGRTFAEVSGHAGGPTADNPSAIIPNGEGTSKSVTASAPAARTSTALTPSASAAVRTSAVGAAPTPVVAREAGRFDTKAFYLVLVVAALLAGMVVEFTRHFGVRLLWS